MFKVGDRVRLNKNKEGHYSYGRGDVSFKEIGIITEVINDEYRVRFPSYIAWNGRGDDVVLATKFTKADLQDGDIVTYRNDCKRIVISNKLINDCGVTTEFIDEYRDDLMYKDRRFNRLDIVKIESPTSFRTVYEHKEEILDKKEKRYLRNIIKPFKVKSISKEGYDTRSYYYLRITFEDGTEWDFPEFEKEKNMYEGMKLNKEYTLEELDL